MHRVYSTEWDLVVNIGIKCNASPISHRVGQRYISSPFDNMDSVDGFREAGDLIANRFEGMFGDRSKWRLRNDRAPRQTEIRAKVAWNVDYPNLLFPHFHTGWIPGTTRESIKEWISQEDSTLDYVWDGLSNVYSGRKDRLIRLLEECRRVLFLRIDERGQLRRLKRTNVEDDSRYFCERLCESFPQTEFGLLYLYSRREEDPLLTSNDSVLFEPLPVEGDEPEYAEAILGKLTVHPREKIQSLALEAAAVA